MTMKSIFQSAIDNWPEDEAAILCDYWLGLKEDGEPVEELARIRSNDIAHMEHVFNSETDADELKARFHAEINKRMNPSLFSTEGDRS